MSTAIAAVSTSQHLLDILIRCTTTGLRLFTALDFKQAIYPKMSPSGHLEGVAPAPPGATVNFVNPPTQTTANIVMYTTLLVACFICLLIRLYTRLRITRSFGFDDGESSLVSSETPHNGSSQLTSSLTAFCIAGFVRYASSEVFYCEKIPTTYIKLIALPIRSLS